MADISKITLIDGVTYNIKDAVARGGPIETRVYNNIIATAAESRYASFYYMRFRAPAYLGRWRIKVRVRAIVPGSGTNANLYNTDSTIEAWGAGNSYSAFITKNVIQHASYRPINYHCFFFASETGYNNGCSEWIGFNLNGCANPTDTTVKRQVTVDLLEYENCEYEFFDTPYMPDTIPNRSAHTNWYTSTVTSQTNLNAYTSGVKMTGDADTTTIHSLYQYQGNHIAHSTLYRYQLLFHVNENYLTPLNNVSNTTGTSKAMLTEVEFDPFMPIYYYGTTTTVNSNANIGAGATYWHYSGIDLRYTLNCGTTLTAHRPIYLVVTPTTNGKCKIASTTPWAQTLPSTADGNWYILLGRTYSTYQFTLYADHPVFEYNGTSVVRVLPYTAITNAEIDAITGGT